MDVNLIISFYTNSNGSTPLASFTVHVNSTPATIILADAMCSHLVPIENFFYSHNLFEIENKISTVVQYNDIWRNKLI